MSELKLLAFQEALATGSVTRAHHATLGSYATIQNDRQFQSANTLEILGNRALQDTQYQDLNDISHEAVDELRSQILKIDAFHDPTIDIYCDKSVPEILRRGKKSTGKNESYRSWLGELATDGQLLNFSYWNLHNTTRLQNDFEVNLEINMQKQRYKEDVSAAVANGWLSINALGSIKNVDSTKVYIGDIFDTYCEDRAGYYRVGSSWLVIAGERTNGTQNQSTVRNVRSLLSHELNHAVLGRFPDRWINEATTEHIAQSLKFGQEEIVSPKDRKMASKEYNLERELLNNVLTLGDNVILSREVTRAYSDTSKDGIERFYDIVDASWSKRLPDGFALIPLLESYINVRTKQLENNGMRNVEAQDTAVEAASEIIKNKDISKLVEDSRRAERRPVIFTSSCWL